MTALPKNISINPIPDITVNRKQFLTIRKNAAAHDAQKCLSVSTT